MLLHPSLLYLELSGITINLNPWKDCRNRCSPAFPGVLTKDTPSSAIVVACPQLLLIDYFAKFISRKMPGAGRAANSPNFHRFYPTSPHQCETGDLDSARPPAWIAFNSHIKDWRIIISSRRAPKHGGHPDTHNEVPPSERPGMEVCPSSRESISIRPDPSPNSRLSRHNQAPAWLAALQRSRPVAPKAALTTHPLPIPVPRLEARGDKPLFP